MTNENWVPTTDAIRSAYNVVRANEKFFTDQGDGSDAEFDRWLEDRDRVVIGGAIVAAYGECERHGYLGSFATATCEAHGYPFGLDRYVCDRVLWALRRAGVDDD